MSYLRKIEYEIIPEEAFGIVRNCPGCGCKTLFRSTNCFRVNANGNKIDVWLIYQCVKCRHTNNLTVYERQNAASLLPEEYEKFLKNSAESAFQYGTDRQFFARNKAEIDWSHITYTVRRQGKAIQENKQVFQKGDLLVVRNRYLIKLRRDKIVSELLNLTRSKIKELEGIGIIVVEEEKQQHIIKIKINENIE